MWKIVTQSKFSSSLLQNYPLPIYELHNYVTSVQKIDDMYMYEQILFFYLFSRPMI